MAASRPERNQPCRQGSSRRAGNAPRGGRRSRSASRGAAFGISASGGSRVCQGRPTGAAAEGPARPSHAHGRASPKEIAVRIAVRFKAIATAVGVLAGSRGRPLGDAVKGAAATLGAKGACDGCERRRRALNRFNVPR